MADFDDGSADGDPVKGSEQGSSAIEGGLLDPKTFPSPWIQLTRDVPSIAPPVQEITGPLRTDPGSEVLQDILDAQARMNGQAKAPRLAPYPETWSINGQPYYATGARSFDPTRSSGVTSMPTPDDSAAALAGMSLVAVPVGREEKAGYIAHSPSRVVAVRGQAGGGEGFDTYTYKQPADSPPIHGHIDRRAPSPSDGLLGSSVQPSDGFVDSTEARGGMGDAWSLQGQKPQPLATVSHGQVGWHVLDNGQLKFLYPPGSMTPFQIQKMQSNLDQEQKKLLRPK